MNDQFPSRLRRARKAAGLNQSQLAEMVGITQRSITSYESGRAVPHNQTRKRLAEALNVSVAYLNGTEVLPEDKEVEEIAELLRRNMAFFAGGEVPQAAKDAFFEALMTAYVECKNVSRERADSARAQAKGIIAQELANMTGDDV